MKLRVENNLDESDSDKENAKALRFMDAYRKGLNRNQGAWANKKYRGHRIIPDSILEELEKANIY